MVSRTHILAEIKRTAAANKGEPLGSRRFADEAGIKEHDWQKYWARWGEVLQEAGFAPNEWQGAYDRDLLAKRLVELARKLGKAPTSRDLQVEHHRDITFPDKKTFASRLGKRHEMAAAVVEYCERLKINEDIVQFFEPLLVAEADESAFERDLKTEFGFVYLLRSGRNYKIGKTNAVGRRERELAIQLPEKATKVHSIKTDDPTGIETYWHQRFESKRKHGEWFELNAADVSAFKRRKFM